MPNSNKPDRTVTIKKKENDMSTKSHSGLKRTLAWMLTVAMMAQGCVVYADDFTSEPEAADVAEAVSETVIQVRTVTWNLLMMEKIRQQMKILLRSVMKILLQM